MKRLRTHRGVTLTELAAKTGISKSTLSRLETGQRKPSLELLLPIAHAHHVPLDELVGATEIGDPRIRPRARKRNGRIVIPLSENTRGVNAWKVLIPPERGEPEFRVHEGYEWLYVLSGRMRLILGEHDITMGPARWRSSTRSCRTGSARPTTSPWRCSACTIERATSRTCAPSRERLGGTRAGNDVPLAGAGDQLPAETV